MYAQAYAPTTPGISELLHPASMHRPFRFDASVLNAHIGKSFLIKWNSYEGNVLRSDELRKINQQITHEFS